MDTPLYNRAHNCTKRAMRRFKNRWGHINYYSPRKIMIERWMSELNLTEDEIREQLSKERRYLVKQNYGVDFPF